MSFEETSGAEIASAANVAPESSPTSAVGVPASSWMSSVKADLEYEVKAPTHFCFNLEAARIADQDVVSESLTVYPPVEMHSYCDENSGNRFVRFDAGPGPLRLSYRANVKVHAQSASAELQEVPVNAVPDNVLRYLMPSRYCESDVMGRAAVQLFGNVEPGIGRVQKVVQWIHDSIEYIPLSTTSTTTAQEVFVKRAGVCRDFAHLGITMCRALNIPARLVVGYVRFDEPPQDFHAIFEAWLGGRWVLFDPTGMAPVDRVVRVGTGRDAKDVAFATMFGAVDMTRKDVLVIEDRIAA
ncbi:MAG: transglutaminase family protein [Burkholderiaceae bacterium]